MKAKNDSITKEEVVEALGRTAKRFKCQKWAKAGDEKVEEEKKEEKKAT